MRQSQNWTPIRGQICEPIDTDIAEMGFSERFRRLWDYYLCYCEAGFRAETIDVGFYVLAKG